MTPGSTSTSFAGPPVQPTIKSVPSPTSCQRITPGTNTSRSADEGEPFFFYLDPHVHEELVEVADGIRAWRGDRAGNRTRDSWICHRRRRLGDRPNEALIGLNYFARRNTTAQWRDRFGLFSYWNHGPPDQPSAEAIEAAQHGLRYGDDQGQARADSTRGAGEGPRHLSRATVYPGRFNGIDDEAERLSNGLPSADADRETQVDEMIQSMRWVVDWVDDTY